MRWLLGIVWCCGGAFSLSTSSRLGTLPALNAHLRKIVGLEKAVVADTRHGLGLVVERAVRKGEVVARAPLDACLTPTLDAARKARLRAAEVVAGEPFPCWSGDCGMLALQLVDRESDAWTSAFPESDADFGALPLCDELVGESVASSRAFESLVDNAKDDLEWLVAANYFAEDEVQLPAWRRSVALALTRSFVLENGETILAPGADFANHDDVLDPRDREVGVRLEKRLVGGVSVALVASVDLDKGEELRCSYGPLSAAEYLETYGFSPRRGAARRASATCELRFELSPSQRFYDDKVGVLQRAELVEEDEEDVGFEFCLGGEPDPEVMRFLRLRELDKADAFLLEAIFEREVWDFMDAPVSAENEGAALRLLAEECRVVAATLATPLEGEELERVRTTELTALDATLRWTDAQLGSLNTKEYYQERRLKDLGLDTEWSVDGAQWTASSSLGSTDW